MGYTCSPRRFAYRCSLTCWHRFYKLNDKKSFPRVLSTVPTHTDVWRCAESHREQIGVLTLWPTGAVLPGTMGTRLCVQRDIWGERKSKILLIRTKQKTLEARGSVMHGTPRTCHTWALGVQTLRAASGGNSMSSVPNPTSCPIWHSQQGLCRTRRILY